MKYASICLNVCIMAGKNTILAGILAGILAAILAAIFCWRPYWIFTLKYSSYEFIVTFKHQAKSICREFLAHIYVAIEVIYIYWRLTRTGLYLSVNVILLV